MSIEANKTIARRWAEEVWGKADVSVAEQLAHPDITVDYPLLPETVHGSDAFKQVLLVLAWLLAGLEWFLYQRRWIS